MLQSADLQLSLGGPQRYLTATSCLHILPLKALDLVLLELILLELHSNPKMFEAALPFRRFTLLEKARLGICLEQRYHPTVHLGFHFLGAPVDCLFSMILMILTFAR